MVKYTQETLERAVDLVQSGAMSQLAASKLLGVPQSTLNDKILGKTPLKKQKKTVLSDEEEKKLVHWIIEMSKRGFGRSKDDIKDIVKILLDKRGAETVFRDNRPGKDWMAAFLSRHKEILEMMTQALGKEKAMITTDSLQKWFEDLNRYVDSMDPTLFHEPRRIFNADELGFSICPKTKKVLDPAGMKHIYQMTSSTRTQITVLVCSSAAGEFLPPLLIFPYQRNYGFNPLEGFERAFFQKTKNGWISTEVFYTWIRDVFIPAVEDKPKPILLYIDEHTSHITSIETCELCQDKGVLLYCLRPDSSHIIQPLDQAYFDVFKRAWSEAVRKHTFVTGEVVSLPTFSRVLSEAWKVAARPEISFSGFARSGLFPFDPSVGVNSEKMKASDSFKTPSDHPQKIPDCESFSEKLNIFEELVKMGSKTNLKNIKRIREGFNVADANFSRWKDLVLAMFGIPISSVSEPPISQSPQYESMTLALQRKHTASRSSSELTALSFEPSTSGIEPLVVQRFEPLTSRIEPSTSRIEPSNSRDNHVSEDSSSTSIDEILVLPTIKTKNTHVNKKDTCRTMALSSDEYINILKSKEKKKALENTKERRKLDKEEKKKNKEKMEKEKKRQKQIEKELVRERKEKDEEAKKEKERKKEKEKKRKRKEKGQKGKGSSKKRIRLDVSDDDDDNFTYDDDNDGDECMEDQEIVLEICRGCHGKEEHTEWVKCKICESLWHVSCVKDENVKVKRMNELDNFDFCCELCLGKG